MDNQNYYSRNGDLSYELDREHTDRELTYNEMILLSEHLEGVRTAVHLCCGAGRHVVAFRKMGISSVGIDISRHLLNHGVDNMKSLFNSSFTVFAEGDILDSPIKDNCSDCVTLMGNSLCLIPKNKWPCVFCEVDRMLQPNGIFVMDLPDPAFLKGDSLTASKTSQILDTKKLGKVRWEWIRHLNETENVLISEETIHFCGCHDASQPIRLIFELSLNTPKDVCSVAESYRLHPEREFFCVDNSGRYKGMLRKRVFYIFRKSFKSGS